MLELAFIELDCLILTLVFLMATQLASAIIWVHVLTSNYCRMMGLTKILLRNQIEEENEVLLCNLETRMELMWEMVLEEDPGWSIIYLWINFNKLPCTFFCVLLVSWCSVIGSWHLHMFIHWTLLGQAF